jgi:hypothetical protein
MLPGTTAALFALLVQSGPASPSPPPPPCSAPEYRQFDFWLGRWQVRGAKGQVVGTNRIEAILGGCALRESWTGRDGSVGTSLNAWDPFDRRWHQTWVDSDGLRLELAGEYAGGRMTLSGDGRSLAPPTRTVRHRITWSRLPEGRRVRQLWEVSGDGGQTWKAVFDGTYVPEAAADSSRLPSFAAPRATGSRTDADAGRGSRDRGW